MSVKYKKLLKIAHAARVNPVFLGRHGLGKTAITKGLENEGYGLVTLIASQLDPTTIGGFPTKVPYGDDGEFKMIYAVPDFVIKLREIAAAGLIPLLFLDEFNRGDRYVENAFMTLVLEKEINGHKLPENTLVVAAMNPASDDDLGVSELTAPMMDRFAWLFFEPSSDEWLDWADSNVNPLITGLIRKDRNLLDGFPFTDEMKAPYLEGIKPTRRSWDAAGRLLDVVTENGVVNKAEFTDALPLFMGLLGAEATASLETHINDTDLALFTPEEILNADDAVIERVKDLVERNQTQVILASLETAHKAIGEKYKGEVSDKAVKELGNLDKGFARFLLSVPVDIAATFFAIEDEFEQFFTNLLVKDDFPEEMVDLLVG